MRSAVAFGVPHPDLGQEVGAVAVIAGAAVSRDEIMTWLAERLDPAWRPAHLALVHEPVRTDAGKTSRGAWSARVRGKSTGSAAEIAERLCEERRGVFGPPA